MKTAFKLLTFSFLLMLAGCVSSLNPLYTDQDLIYDPTVLGVWSDKDSKETWVFTQANEKEYKVIYTDEDGKEGEFRAHLLKIDGKTFLDLTPVKPALSQNDFYKSGFLTTHTFVQITRINEQSAQISYLEPEWVKKFLDKNPTVIRHQKVNNEILFTASTKELQKFLLAHLNTEGAFAKPTIITRKGEILK